LTLLTQSAFLAFGREVLYFQIRFVFVLYERKNEKNIIEKYHAAVRPEPVEGQARSHFQTVTAYVVLLIEEKVSLRYCAVRIGSAFTHYDGCVAGFRKYTRSRHQRRAPAANGVDEAAAACYNRRDRRAWQSPRTPSVAISWGDSS
jgi:hypothetical protein